MQFTMRSFKLRSGISAYLLNLLLEDSHGCFECLLNNVLWGLGLLDYIFFKITLKILLEYS